MYTCAPCNKIFEKKQSYCAHRSHHNRKPFSSNKENFICKFCSKKFLLVGQLSGHVPTCNKNPNYDLNLNNLVVNFKRIRVPGTSGPKPAVSESNRTRWNDRSKRHKIGWIKGYYISRKSKISHYRSSYEKEYYNILESNSSVLTYEVEPLTIYYNFNNEIKRYIPDLLVYYKDKKELVEIKPSDQLECVKNLAKFKAAKEYCKENGLQFVIVTEKDIFKLH